MAKQFIDTKDVLLDDTKDIQWVNGDIAFRDSYDENLEALIGSLQGEYKTDLNIGVNMQDYLNSPLNTTNKLRLSVLNNLDIDGWEPTQFTFDQDIASSKLNININALKIR